MGKFIDLTGQQFNNLTVIKRDNERQGNCAYWLCQCSCGNPKLKSVRGCDLKAGKVKTCKECNKFKMIGQKFGHLSVLDIDLSYKEEHNIATSDRSYYYKCLCDCGNPNTIIVSGKNLRSGHSQTCRLCLWYKMVGQRFGRLSVLEIDSNKTKNGIFYYKCLCDCGKIVSKKGINLRNGHTQSCGCLQKEVAAEIGKKSAKELTNQSFGKLIALYPTELRNNNGDVIWHCKCECGNECNVNSHALLNGGTQSCGCLGASYGEAVITKILQENNIKYEKEKSFDNFKSEKGWAYRYDFYLPDYNRLIEFDGKQHFESAASLKSWNTQEKLEQTKERDKIKNEYAKSHNIELIRIPYWERDNITFEMIMGDQYLIEGD